MSRIFKEKSKTIPISKQMVWEAFKKIKKKKGLLEDSSMDKRDERKRTFRRSIEKSVTHCQNQEFPRSCYKCNGYLFTGYMAVGVKEA